MPAVTTSSATGSRVLQKPMAADALETQRDEATPGKSTPVKAQQEISPGKRASSSSTMSSKMKRFPTLLSRKESRSKAESTLASGYTSSPRSASNADGRRKSTSIPPTAVQKPSTPSHGRSISLAAAAPSSLPRPVAVAGLASSATSPNLAGTAGDSVDEQPPSPISFGGYSRRVPPPGQESGIPRLVTSPRTASEAQKQHLTNEQGVDYQNGLTDHVDEGPSSTPGHIAGSVDGGVGTEEDPGTIPSKASSAKLYLVTVPSDPEPKTFDATASSEHMSRTSSASRLPVAMAKTTGKNMAPQTGTSPETSVPAMWRSSSYEGGTAHAYITASQASNDSKGQISSHSQIGPSVETSPVAVSDHPYRGAPAIGIDGLQMLEKDPSVVGKPAILHRIQLLHQLVFLRGNAVLSGVNVAEIVWAKGTDAHISVEEEFSRARNGKAISQTGSPATSLATVSASPLEHGPAATISTSKKHGILDRMTARFGGTHKSHQGDSNADMARPEMTPAEVTQTMSSSSQNPGDSGYAAIKKGPVFGVPLQDIPPLALAISIIGGQRHQLPILVFSLVEAIFKRGLETSGIFRLNGDASSVERLVQVYNTWPSYGDDQSTDDETIFTLCQVLKKYLNDLPEPLLGGSLWTIFLHGCLADPGQQDDIEHYKRMGAVQIIFRLLPRKNMSLLIYLIAFLYQVSLRPANGLTVESISVIFGRALLGSSKADKGNVSGMDHSTTSSEGLRWLLENWEDSLSQDLLDEDYDCFASPFVGQTAWSTPNLLGDVSHSSKPRDAASSIDRVQSGNAGHNEPDTSAVSPHLTQEPPQNERNDIERAGDSTVHASSVEKELSDIQMASEEQEPLRAARSENRSISGFAKGENFSDDDISSDPNAAQLFGSLSALFTSERRKAKAYRQQVLDLEQRQAACKATIADLQDALARNNLQMSSTQKQILDMQRKIDLLEAEAQASSRALISHRATLAEAQRTLREREEAHNSIIAEKESQMQVLSQQHERELAVQREGHKKAVEQKVQGLQVQYQTEKQQEISILAKQHEDYIARIKSEHDSEKAELLGEMHRLREAVQSSIQDRDAARAHLQRIRNLLDSA